MAEGFFRKDMNADIPNAVIIGSQSVMRLGTGRRLHYRMFKTVQEADQWSGFSVDQHGTETYQSGWTLEEVENLSLEVPGSDWARGFVHELIVHLAGGGTLPYETVLTGYGTATLISDQGYLITNQHMLTGPQTFYEFPERSFQPEGIEVPQLQILTEQREALGPVKLCYIDTSLDLAVVKVPPPQHLRPIGLAPQSPKLHERVWQWGYPHRTCRDGRQRRFLGYEDADHELRYCPGLIVAEAGQPEWFSDGDAVLGSSGSAMLNDAGLLVGLYRTGGPHQWGLSQPTRYRRCVDIKTLKTALPEIFES